jgi:hypothetical protein
MPSFKVSILEKDGVEFEYPVEYDLAQALSELGLGADYLSSYERVQGSISVSLDKQMIVQDCFTVTSGGTVELIGTLVVKGV